MQKASMGLMARKRICGEASIYATLSVCVCTCFLQVPISGGHYMPSLYQLRTEATVGHAQSNL